MKNTTQLHKFSGSADEVKIRKNYTDYSTLAYNTQRSAVALMHKLGALSDHPGATAKESEYTNSAKCSVYLLSNKLIWHATRAENTKHEIFGEIVL